MKFRSRFAALAAVVGLVAAGLAAFTAPNASAAPNKVDVIITLAPHADPAKAARAAARGNSGKVTHVFKHVLNGYSASLPQAAVDALQKAPNVLRIEIDRGVTASEVQDPTPSWGLDRVDDRTVPGDGTFEYDVTGAGVTAYVVDTGIATDHADFNGRARHGTDTVDDDSDASDCNGHGTHVAGTIGGEQYGIAKDVDLVGVRVLDCDGSGSTAGVIAGLDWVVEDHAAGEPAVANMSLGGGRSASLDNAVRNVIADGVTMAVAAGNENANACNGSPSRVAEALTVGASDSADTRASFSNVGDCVDLFAPGVDITSAWLSGGTNTISGTSMASPHVAGVAAQYLQVSPDASPAAVSSEILSATTKDVVSDTEGGCLLLFLFCTPATPNNDVLFTSY